MAPKPLQGLQLMGLGRDSWPGAAEQDRNFRNVPKMTPQTIVTVGCNFVLLGFAVVWCPLFRGLEVSYLGDPQKLHVWQSEKHV